MTDEEDFDPNDLRRVLDELPPEFAVTRQAGEAVLAAQGSFDQVPVADILFAAIIGLESRLVALEKGGA